MSLFLVHHHHDPDRCPAEDLVMAPMLLKHLSPSNAKSFGVAIHAEAVVDGAHALYMIVDAPSRDALSAFMQPFAQTGSVEILPASPCEVVVERGGCDVRE